MILLQARETCSWHATRLPSQMGAWPAQRGPPRASAAAANHVPAPVAHISVQWRRLRGAIRSTSRFSVAAPPVVPGLAVPPPRSPERDCNLSRSLLQLTFPSKYQLWPLAGLELKGSSANLTGPVRCHLAGRETRAAGAVCLPPRPPARMPSGQSPLLITLLPLGRAC